MAIRNGVIDDARADLENYLIEKNITAKEWLFIKNYIDSSFEVLQNNIKLEK